MGIEITGKLSTQETGEQVCSVYVINLMEAVGQMIDPKSDINAVLAAALNVILMATGATTARFGSMVACAVAELGIEELVNLKKVNFPLMTEDQRKQYPEALASAKEALRRSTMPVPGLDGVLRQAGQEVEGNDEDQATVADSG